MTSEIDEKIFRDNIKTATELLDRAKDVQSSTTEYSLRAIGILLGQIAIELHETNNMLEKCSPKVAQEKTKHAE